MRLALLITGLTSLVTEGGRYQYIHSCSRRAICASGSLTNGSLVFIPRVHTNRRCRSVTGRRSNAPWLDHRAGVTVAKTKGPRYVQLRRLKYCINMQNAANRTLQISSPTGTYLDRRLTHVCTTLHIWSAQVVTHSRPDYLKFR